MVAEQVRSAMLSIVDELVLLIMEEIIRQRTVEQIIDVPAVAGCGRNCRGAQERISECIVQEIVGPSRVQQSRQTPLESERGLAVTQTTNEQQIRVQQEFAHQSQFASCVSAVTKFGLGAVEDSLCLINRLQSQA